MPHFTPTRALIVVTGFLLLSFLWAWGLPHQYAAPVLPALHDLASQGKPAAAQLLPEPLVENVAEGGQPKEEEESLPTTAEPDNDPAPPPTGDADVRAGTGCRDARGAEHVMIVVRTSRIEAEKGLPANLARLLSCAHHVLFFSDHEGEIGGHRIVNALDTVPEPTMSKHSEFIEYRKMQKDKKYTPSAQAAEALDKWKWLPMVYKTATMAPHHRFYLFVDPDTSLSWTNLLQWLDRLDYRIPYYSGVHDTADDQRYARSGPGVLLSYGALQQYWATYEDRYATQWEHQVGTGCCGDVMLAAAMKQSRVELYSSFGLFEPEKPSDLIWSEKFWCTPVVSWYHVPQPDADLLWESQVTWTKEYGWAQPYTHYDAFETFVRPHLAEEMKDWDNISSDTQLVAEKGRHEKLTKDKQKAIQSIQSSAQDKEKGTPLSLKASSKPSALVAREEEPLLSVLQSAADSPKNCKLACQRTEDCLQWKHTTTGEGACHLGKALRLGSKVEKPESAPRWTSGWILERANKLTEKWGKCEIVDWKFNQ